MLADRILFIDAEAIVLDKPAGLPVDAPRRGGDSIAARIDELQNRLLAYRLQNYPKVSASTFDVPAFAGSTREDEMPALAGCIGLS